MMKISERLINLISILSVINTVFSIHAREEMEAAGITEEEVHNCLEYRQLAEVKEYSFGFKRKVTISGKSLVVGIPVELADHLDIKQGTKVRIFPIATEGFMIKLT